VAVKNIKAAFFLDLDSPASSDQRLNSTDTPETFLDLVNPAESSLQARRYLQLCLASGDNHLMLSGLKLLEGIQTPGIEGIRLRSLASLHRYEEIRAAPPLYPNSNDPLELENVLDYEMAMCDARSHFGDKAQALAHIHGAQLLASSLGMMHRTQWLRIELGRLLTLTGKPASSQIREAMKLIPMTKRRTDWSTETLAEAYISEGEFRHALQLLDDRCCPLWHFVAALMGLEETRDSLRHLGGHYAELASAVWKIRSGEEYTLRATYSYYPQKGYAQVLRARSMISNPALKYQSVSALTTMSVPDMTQDQRVYLAVMKLGACADNGDVLVAMAAIQELHDALDSLSTLEHVLPLLHAMNPNRAALAALVPGAHPDLALRLCDLPILVGEHVNFRSRAIKLPGKSLGGVSMVHSAFLGEPVTLHHEASKRMRQALTKHDVTLELVNIGYILRCLQRLRDAALPEQRGPWQAAMENALALVDSRALQNDLRKTLMPL